METANYIVIGSSCLRDYMGHQDPTDIARYFECVSSLDSLESFENDGGGERMPTMWELDTFLSYVAAEIRANGWLSRTTAQNLNKMSTCDCTMTTMYHMAKGALDKVPPEYRPGEVDRARANKAMEFMGSFLQTKLDAGETLNDYLYNLWVVMKAGVVNNRTAGIAASLVPTAEREMGQEVERRKFLSLKKTSTYLGAVGDKITLKVWVRGIRELESDWGVTTLINFVTEDNQNALTWFASGAVREDWEKACDAAKDGILTIAGKIKKHETYEGMKQTVLTRVVWMTQEAIDLENAKAAKKAAREAKKAQKALAPSPSI